MSNHYFSIGASLSVSKLQLSLNKECDSSGLSYFASRSESNNNMNHITEHDVIVLCKCHLLSWNNSEHQTVIR
ncbi:hypothetical protein T11_16482 [Trichinella zimbabwensis]|uniref:Uncharacterized protein n=1 Tax=Trichinella zimbabwensis TaxID=268475 RepID=A0A0V1GWS2_9BILA|nr:hypothetical protein T11_16482 [Trichinella zimbabwensis]